MNISLVLAARLLDSATEQSELLASVTDVIYLDLLVNEDGAGQAVYSSSVRKLKMTSELRLDVRAGAYLL